MVFTGAAVQALRRLRQGRRLRRVAGDIERTAKDIQPGLYEPQLSVLDETLLRERDAMQALFKYIEDSVVSVAGGSNDELMERGDGWNGLRERYGLRPEHPPDALDHSLVYNALDIGKLDATDVYSTDAQIIKHRLRVLEDENAKLKRMLADAMLDNVALKDLLGKKW